MFDISKVEENEMTKEKIVVIYHHPCNDGFGAALAAHLFYSPQQDAYDVRYLPMNYGDVVSAIDFCDLLSSRFGFNEADIAETVFEIFDFSLPLEVYEHLKSFSRGVVMRDHHLSAFQKYAPTADQEYFRRTKPNEDLLLDNSKSGAVLAWGYYFHSQPVPRLFRYLQDWDLWTKQLPYCTEITSFLHSQEQTLSNWAEIMDDMEDAKSFKEMAKVGSVLVNERRKTIEKLTKNPLIIWLDGQSGYAVNAPGFYASEIGEALAIEGKGRGYGFGASFYIFERDNKIMARVSLRSLKEVLFFRLRYARAYL